MDDYIYVFDSTGLVRMFPNDPVTNKDSKLNEITLDQLVYYKGIWYKKSAYDYSWWRAEPHEIPDQLRIYAMTLKG